MLTKPAFRRFRCNESGNFTVWLGLMLLPLFVSIGMAVEYIDVSKLRSEALIVTDASVMAASVAARDKTDWKNADSEKKQQEVLSVMRTEFENFFSSNASDRLKESVLQYKLAFDSESQQFTADVALAYEMLLLDRLAPDGLKFEVASRVKVLLDQQSTLSIELVLDDSGSMGERDRSCVRERVRNRRGRLRWKRVCTYGESRTDMLKDAVTAMLGKFDSLDPDKKLIRAGSVSYSNGIRTEAMLNWSRSNVRGHLNALHSSGGTYAYSAMNRAHYRFASQLEDKAHEKKTGKPPRKAIVLMSDGVIADSSSTLSVCRKAKDDGMDVYTVGFMSPSRGLSILRQCASSADKFYDAKDKADLIAAFEKIGEDSTKNILYTN